MATEAAMLALEDTQPELLAADVAWKGTKATGKFIWSNKFIISLIIIFVLCIIIISGTLSFGVLSDSGEENNVLLFITTFGFSVIMISLLMAGKFISDETFGLLIISLLGIAGGSLMIGSGLFTFLGIPKKFGINIFNS
jgi:membrane-anchored glycerophosphoryl diester phosphodiesterase (GDPDase)